MIIRQRKYNRRQQQGLLYRKGASSIEDEKAFSGNEVLDDDAPKGLDDVLPVNNKFADIRDVAGSEVLIVYFAKMGHSVKSVVDLDYLKTLIRSGANLNYTDRHGQTVLHEVALRWPVEVAQFLLENGADVNASDNFGRTPLHVAASIDFPDMVKWLVANGANIHARTFQENQSPIHYAAKYNAVDSIVTLVNLDGRLDDRDHKERTPLQLASESGRENATRTLLDLGAPAGVYDDTGTSCLTHMIEKMPDVAAMALNQFQRVDKTSRTLYYYLSYLETYKWKLLRLEKSQGSRLVSNMQPLEAIIKFNESKLIMHPVIQRLLAKKLELYGRRYFITNLFVNFMFTVIWTALTVTLPGPEQVEAVRNAERPCLAEDIETCRLEFYLPVSKHLWRIVLEAIGLLMAVGFVLKIRFDSGVSVSEFHKYKRSRMQELKRDLPYCHPRWPQESKFVKEEIKRVESERVASLYDMWYYLDVICFLGLVLLTITRLILVEIDFNTGNAYVNTMNVHYHAYAFLLIIIWLRFMQAFRPFISLGPFIAMLGYVASDTLKFAFLFCEFFIPYCCAIWIVFGGRENSGKYQRFNDLVFEVWRMSLIDSFAFEDMTKQAKIVAQLFAGTYIAVSAISCMNLYIALLSETFSRVFGNATATAYMLQGEALISVEKKMSRNRQQTIQKFVAEECSPEVVYDKERKDDESSPNRDVISDVNQLRRLVEQLEKMQKEMQYQTEYLQAQGTQTISSQAEFMKELDYINGSETVKPDQEEFTAI